MRKYMILSVVSVLPALAAADETIIGGRLEPVVVPVPMYQGPEIGGSFDIRFENDTGFWELGVGLHVSAKNGQDGAAWVEGGRSWYLSEADPGIYLGVGVQGRLVGEGGQTVPGGVFCGALGVHAQAGLMFWRTQSTRMYVELRATQNLFPFACEDAFKDSVDSTRQQWRTETELAVGFGF